MRQVLTSDKLPGPKFKYSPCVKVGPIHQVAGLVGLSLETGTLVDGGPGFETKKILENLSAALPDWGLSWDHLYSARLFTTAFDRFSEINEAWGETFSEVAPPARTAVGVTALPLGASVEIEFTFYKD